MACAHGVSRREAKAKKKTGSSSSMSYATSMPSYYPTASPRTIGEADNDSLVQQGQEGNSNGVDGNDNYESTVPTSTTSTDSATTQATTDVVTTISTAQSTPISSTDASSTLSTPSSTSSTPLQSDDTDGSSCTVLAVDSEDNVLSVEIPFYYRLETTIFDDEILTIIDNTLLSGMCSVSESIRRLSDTKVLEWNTNPKDKISAEYICTPSSEGAQLCNIVEAGMTVYYDGEEDEAAIETHAYQQIEDQFSSLSVDDSRVVSVQYLGNSPLIEEEDLSYVPSPFVITASGILLFALMIGIYGVLMRGRRKGKSSSDNDTLPPPTAHEEVESIYATKEDESQATTVLHANTPDVDTSILPIVPRYSDNDDETMHTLKQFVLGEDVETRTEWERLGILPVVAQRILIGCKVE